MSKYLRPTMESMPSDTALIVLLAIESNRTMTEIAKSVGKSIGMVQRYFRYLEEMGLIETVYGETGKKSKNRGRKLTDAGRMLKVGYGHGA